MPLLKYTLLVGVSLFAIIAVAGQMIQPEPSAAAKQASSSSSLELLRKMANHGELRPFASAAAAGPFLAMPVVTAPVVATVEPVAKSVTIAATSITTPSIVVPSSSLDAQARLEETVSAEPARPAKKIAARKAKPRVNVDYVENVQRGPSGFFGAFQSW